MVRGFTGLAALCFTLAPAAMAQARDPVPNDGEYVLTGVAVRSGEATPRNLPLLSAGRQRVRVSTERSLAQDGNAMRRTGVISSLPLTGGAEIGVGLFSITGAERIDRAAAREMRRADP
ncbi:MAG TPA: hypothetical protein VGB65_01560, partial [Allosphingosinicella sp.]